MAETLRRRSFYQLNTDGGIDAVQGQSEGEASVGVVLRDPNGRLVHELSACIGWAKDHQVAEYRALIAGLRLARGHGVDDIHIFMDSRLVVSQLHGKSRVTKEHLQRLHEEASELLAEFRRRQLFWISRKRNADADRLAGRALGR